MDDPAAEPMPDAVLFFDANMPDMYSCSSNCINNNLVFCKHRFDFNVCLVVRRKEITGLNDLSVARFFLNLIKKNQSWNLESRPVFILVTQDLNFIKDVEADYLVELAGGVKGSVLHFINNLIWLDDLELGFEVAVIKHKPYGENRISDLRHMIETVNRFMAKRRAL